MSQEEPAGRPRRPLVVTLAGGLLLLAASALVVYSFPGVVYAEPVLDVYREAYAGTIAEQEVADLSATPYYAFSGALLVIAALLVVLAVPVLRGSRAARVGVWLLGVLVVCAGLPQLLLEPSPPPRPPGAPSPAEMEQMLSAAVPGWVDPATIAGAVVMVLALLLAMVLLALPRANDYFRKPPPTVSPPPPLHSQ